MCITEKCIIVVTPVEKSAAGTQPAAQFVYPAGVMEIVPPRKVSEAALQYITPK